MAASRNKDETGSLASLLRQARDYRVLFHRLMSEHRDGHGLYALTVAMRCAVVRDEPAPLDWVPHSAPQQRSKVLREERCATFIDSELSGDALLALVRDPRVARDAYRLLGDALYRVSSDPVARLPVLERVLRTADPVLLESIVTSLFHAPAGGAVTFAGKTYADMADRQVLVVAWVAAVCGAAPGCDGPGDDYLVNACAARNLCVDSRRALFALDAKERFGERGAALYADVYPRMVEAIRQADTSAFDPRSKTP
ncbi:hypothetical protein [Acidovorax sp. NCPPB 4044]|uniref:hypothetical protein n=1 Tax=Acidovorax sp. NCPPB 4044 TaxID=2940490 RepID=UPI0023036EEB|nr:hypothetical protein [Acidovorax sp. NCPPB 4044]MDA8523497.1 hypothetical protein [Acidovorax sp. NCPPB 4044]